VEVRALASAANALGPHDAVIHNAAVGDRESRGETVDGLEHVFATNVLAPYLLSVLLARPRRLVFLTSGMHLGGDADLRDAQWRERRWNGTQAYSDSKLWDVVLAFAFARRWPEVRSNAVDPGWVPTRMGGPGAPDDLEQGALTQVWLAASEDPAALVSGRCFHHQRERDVHPAAREEAAQEALLRYCAQLSGTAAA